jgi:hypothetical protein
VRQNPNVWGCSPTNISSRYILHPNSGPFLCESDAHLTVSFACASYLSTSRCLIGNQYSEQEQVLRVAKGFHALHQYAHGYLIEHVLHYAELQQDYKSTFSAALVTQLEKLLLFRKEEISVDLKTVLDDHKSLPDIEKRLLSLELPPILYTLIRDMLVFQEMSAQDNHHQDDPQGE